MTFLSRYAAFVGVGFMLGLLLVVAAFWEARLGHGTYTLWAIASCPGLVLGLGSPTFGISLFLSPLFQWTLIGFAVAKVAVGRKIGWSYVIMGMGGASIFAALIGHSAMRGVLSSAAADNAAIAGFVVGVVLMVAGLILRLTVRAKSPRIGS